MCDQTGFHERSREWYQYGLQGPHSGFVVSKRFKSHFRGARPAVAGPESAARPELSVDDGELGTVQLRLLGIDPHPILQVGKVRRGRLPIGYRSAQGIEECSLPGRIAIRVLGQLPRCRGAVLTGQCPPWPAPDTENFPEPAGVVLVDALPLCRYLVRKPDRVLSLGWGHKSVRIR